MTVEQETNHAFARSRSNAGLGVWHPIETVPAHTSVLFWREDSGWFEGKYTSLDGELSDSELENSGMTEEEIFEMGFWWFSVRGITSLSDDEKPIYWMIPLEPNHPQRVAKGLRAFAQSRLSAGLDNWTMR